MFDSVSDLVLGAGVLIRNSIGAAGLVFLAVLCLIPLAKVALFAVSYQLAAAVVQPVSDSPDRGVYQQRGGRYGVAHEGDVYGDAAVLADAGSGLRCHACVRK